jgi:putative ATPase
MELFEATRSLVGAPLAERMRPRTLDDVVGQAHLLGHEGVLTKLIARGRLPSLILWGPPGTGKTTIADALSRTLDMRFAKMSAVLSGVKDVRAAIDDAKHARVMGRRTLLFIDEIHRFNKSQQDALLPHVEDGTVTLVGATTENPSFEVNAALLSRCRVIVLRALDDDDLARLVDRALAGDEALAALALTITDDARSALAVAAAGDARRLLSSLEVTCDLAAMDAAREITLAHVEQAVARRVVLYDKGGSQHFALASALIKSMRGTDPDAAIYYAVRMLEGGEDPRFVFRRLVIFASEDVGNADPHALTVAVNAFHAFEIMGMPEGVLPLTQAVTYLASAPKSNSAVTTYAKAREDVLAHPAATVPAHIQNAPTKLMKSLGFGDGYQYPHDFAGHHVDEMYLPDILAGRRYYEPSESGVEARIKARLDAIRARASVRATRAEPEER